MTPKKKMIITLLILAIVLFAIAAGAWWVLFFGRPNPPLRQATAAIVAASGTLSATAPAVDDASVPPAPSYTSDKLAVDGAVFTVELATSTLAQTRGLSYRTSLDPGKGMLFIFSRGSVQAFWMKDMHFPLDMIWISGDKVVGFSKDVPPPTAGMYLWQLPVYASPPNTDKVLEVNAGTVARYNIKVGDRIAISSLK